MKVLMFGWEFSPQYTGGLGVVCHDLSNALCKKHEVTFIVPSKKKQSLKIKKKKTTRKTNLRAVSQIKSDRLNKVLNNPQFNYLDLNSNLVPYVSGKLIGSLINKRNVSKKQKELEVFNSIPLTGEYNNNLTAEVIKYSISASELYMNKGFEIIHAHDWIGINAGILAKKQLKIPLIAHIHSIEFDRNGLFGNPSIIKMEKEGLLQSDAIICVSNKTKQNIIEQYQIDPSKITIVPNAPSWNTTTRQAKKNQRTNIGFIGRFTYQKSPEKFIDLARELFSYSSKFSFSMIGTGHLSDRLVHKANQLNLTKQIEFRGFLTRKEIKKILKKITVLVIPSISEPFGLVALEATAMGVPVIITDNAGVCEYIPFKTFPHWDTHKMKQLVIELINHPKKTINYVNDCQAHAKKLKWKKAAKQITKVYEKQQFNVSNLE